MPRYVQTAAARPCQLILSLMLKIRPTYFEEGKAAVSSFLLMLTVERIEAIARFGLAFSRPLWKIIDNRRFIHKLILLKLGD